MRIFFNLESITFVPSLYYTSSIMMTIVWHGKTVTVFANLFHL